MRLLTILLIVLTMGCTKVYNETNPNSPTPVTTPDTTPVINDKIEFRVFGQDLIGNVTILNTDPLNGVTLYTGGVPYFAQVQSKDDSIFLYISATGTGLLPTSGLQVQIFVNGVLFREAFAKGFELSAQASGTFRH